MSITNVTGRGTGPPISSAGGTVFPMGLVLVIDNYDSFVYNLVQYLGELGADPLVYRHDEATLDQLTELEPAGVLISPGPGRPEDAGVSNAAIDEFGRRGVPVLGVCLGHQCIGYVFGGRIRRAPELVHGKTSQIYHRGEGVLDGLPIPFEATRGTAESMYPEYRSKLQTYKPKNACERFCHCTNFGDCNSPTAR